MMIVNDLGCIRHQLRQLRLFGPEAEVMHDLIANLPGDRECRTYICSQGNSHRLTVELDVPELVANMPRSARVIRRLPNQPRFK
jgi:hypothetical protein